ncbi:MAG: hypothetical protein KDC36_10440 [Thermoleophilia bacterium]|nr:hypothetical protein [Thermoleophilia bacterium]
MAMIRSRRLSDVAGLLAVVLALGGGGILATLAWPWAWPIAGAWTVAGIVVGATACTLRTRPVLVLLLGAAAVIATVLLGWVGGIFMLPSALELLVWALIGLGSGDGHRGQAASGSQSAAVPG